MRDTVQRLTYILYGKKEKKNMTILLDDRSTCYEVHRQKQTRIVATLNIFISSSKYTIDRTMDERMTNCTTTCVQLPQTVCVKERKTERKKETKQRIVTAFEGTKWKIWERKNVKKKGQKKKLC